MSTARPTDRELSGMTVNERLFVCGLFPQFEKAAKERRREDMISVLLEVAMTKEQAAHTVDGILTNPSYYGY